MSGCIPKYINTACSVHIMLLVHVFSGWPFKGIRHQLVGFDSWENSKTRRNSKRPHSLALEMRNPFGHRQENLMANYASYTKDNHPSRLQSCLPLTCSLKQIDIIWSRTHLSVYLQWETIGPKVFQPLSMRTKGSGHINQLTTSSLVLQKVIATEFFLCYLYLCL